MKDCRVGGIFFGAILIFISSQISAQNSLSFIDEELSDFLGRTVKKGDRDDFILFFTNFSGQFSTKEVDKQREIRSELFTKALRYLKRDDKSLYDSVDSYVIECKKSKNSDSQKVEPFLSRYGLYMTFLERKAKGLLEQRALPEFVKSKLDEFVVHVVSKEDKEPFSRYYTKVMGEIIRTGDPMKEATLHYLSNRAIESLKAERTAWYEAIKPYLIGKNESVQQFLQKYGAYQEFLEIRAMHGDDRSDSFGLFTKIGSFFSEVGDTVVGWFGFGNTRAV